MKPVGENNRPGAFAYCQDKLLEAAHRVSVTSTTFAVCFPDVDHATLQREWKSFVRSISIDP